MRPKIMVDIVHLFEALPPTERNPVLSEVLADRMNTCAEYLETPGTLVAVSVTTDSKPQ